MSYKPVKGIRLSTVQANIRYKNRDDVLLIEMAENATCAGTFTLNKFCAAPVSLAKAHLAHSPTRYWLVNAGNANAGTGKAGEQAALKTCQLVAEHTGVAEQQVLPFSTGVIGQVLPVGPFETVMSDLVGRLDEDNWPQAADAIMTTDTRPKLASRSVVIDGVEVALTGISKGSGMICPNMATMLAFVATDAKIEQPRLQKLLSDAVNLSFNRITVDGDTSTNDACVLAATGASGAVIDSTEKTALFAQALNDLMTELALAIVKDGEGATKLIQICVTGAQSADDAREVGYTIAHSPLVKTACFASDPNWGRILAAVGRARIDRLDIDRVSVYLGEVCLIKDGQPNPRYREEDGQVEMDKTDILISVDLGLGQGESVAWTCDLSHDYVSINADYRS